MDDGTSDFPALLTPILPVAGDLDCDRVVGAADLGILLGQWGGDGSADLNGSGVVDAADLGTLLGGSTTK
ncbi:MAG: hypothetical protein SGJ09_04835 [Phycisphaerae bacterium]|nr:hypothetical protein [Phycisphaerae bacterium]